MKFKEVNIKNNNEILPGQISIFDIVKTPEKADSSKEVINKKQPVNDSPFTLSQLIAYKKYIASDNVLRIISYYGGSIGIEIKDSNSVKTDVVEKQGSEYSFIGRAGAFPWDKIIYSSEEIMYTSIQKERLKAILDKDTNKVIRVIKRKGDLNILIQEVNKVISIMPNGWVLEFNKLIFIEYQRDEVLKVNACDVI